MLIHLGYRRLSANDEAARQDLGAGVQGLSGQVDEGADMKYRAWELA